MAASPEKLRKIFLKWMYRERDNFVGRKGGKDGSFTRTLLNKRKSSGGTWEKKVAKAFTGRIENDWNLNNMTLRMGLNLSGNAKGFRKGLEDMSENHTQSTSKNMVIPIYENLRTGSVDKNAYMTFKRMARNEEFNIGKSGGKVFYFDKARPGSLLFVTAKRIPIKKQFDFVKAWERRLPGAMNRAQAAIDKAFKVWDEHKNDMPLPTES